MPENQPTSLLDDLIRRTKELFVGAAADTFDRLFGNIMRRAVARLASHLLATAIFSASAVFLMIAGAEGLRSAGLAPWLSHLILGLTGALSAGLILLCSRAKDRKPA